jgi:hypothetical protein
VVGAGGELRARGVAFPERDHTEALRRAARRFLSRHPGLRGMIVKARSPSCAMDDAPVAGTDGHRSAGLFVRELMELRPELAVVDEARLGSERATLEFLLGVLGPDGSAAPASLPDAELIRRLGAVAEDPAYGLGAPARARLAAWLGERA